MISNSDILKLIFGFKIKHLRLQQNKSYQELAGETGLSTSYLNDIEKGKKYPKPDKIQALAASLHVEYDYLISTRTDKKLRPIVELLNSDFFKFFPLDEFGISIEKLVDVFTSAPDKINAFISTILKMVRSYQIEKEHFYRIALRSYQDIHDNYFPDLEEAVGAFRTHYNLPVQIPHKNTDLKQLLSDQFQVKVDAERISQHKNLKGFRSYFNNNKKILHLNKGLSKAQEQFILAKEIGFQYMQLTERPYETELSKEASFEKLLNNFKASYFAAALMMDESSMVKDIQKMARITTWKATLISDLLEKYQVTPENLLQRLTNILPKHFGLNDLFFFRLRSGKGMVDYQMTKELHLSQLHNPYQNETNEHLCQRWVSISAMKKLRSAKSELVIDAQISQYWNTPNAYFCITIAQPSSFNDTSASSVTIGIMMSEKLSATFNCLTPN